MLPAHKSVLVLDIINIRSYSFLVCPAENGGGGFVKYRSISGFIPLVDTG